MAARAVLLISSDPQTIQTLLLLHSAPGAPVLSWAPGVREGLRLLRGPRRFESVLLDLSSGADALRRVLSCRGGVPVTAIAEPGEAERGQAAVAEGASAFRLKGRLHLPAGRPAEALALS